MIRQQLVTVTNNKNWAQLALILLNRPEPNQEWQSIFSTHWIEAGHHIREQIKDDQLLVELLRHIFPPYEGGAVLLFRGENRTRWERGMVGQAWTSKQDTARMFGSGLNAINGGGVLLQALVSPAHIICAPPAHSIYLGEAQFTVEAAAFLSCISVVEQYPSA